MDEWPWLNKARAADLIGLKRARFDESIRPGLKKSEVKGDTRNLRFNAIAVVRVWASQQSERQSIAAAKTVDAESELDVGRAIDNDRKRLGLMKELGKVVSSDQVEQGLMIFAGCIREAGDALMKRYGNDAAEILNEQIQAGERGITSYFERAAGERPAAAAGNGGGEQVEALAIDATVRRGRDHSSDRTIRR